jgi:hypothetical protein
VQVRPEGVVPARTLPAVLGVVAAPLHHPPERLLTRREVGPAAVVLEPDDVSEVRRQDDVSDAAVRARPRVARLQVEDADTGDDVTFVIDVTMPEQLEAATDGERRQPFVDGAAQGRAAFDQVLGDAPLLTVLAAADEDQVEVGRVEGVADVDVGDPSSMPRASQR